MPEPTAGPHGGETLRGLWSLLWHSVILLPLAMALFAVYCYAWAGLLALPIAAGFLLWSSQWGYAFLSVLLWLLSFFFVRWVWRRERADEFKHFGDL